MDKISKFGAVVATAAVFAFSSADAAQRRSAPPPLPLPPHGDQLSLVDQAERTVDHMRSDPAFGPARDMLNRARAVMIIPSLVKGGFIFGAEGGNGVLMERRGNRWSDPAFYTLGSASFGLQIGLEKAEIVMMVMSDRALRAIEDGDVKIGAGGALTVATLSAGAEAATASNLSGDLVIWSSATGIYGGLTLNGSVIKPRGEWNERFYGRPVSVPSILADQVQNREANPLRAKLSSVTVANR
jgi:lipid-binding SYLF domain-containing protein